ncbi:hypothetical protein FRX31_032822 [Thalictrum thalictroides]|uniref:Uncharacterized protein n=1 Tax=Thalictrum thalictroides TaxID=46969 RepID=A0A7J6UY83_THATH|nr:hypothetical protein FRX31_032822 [Thalictrum thalictroides]
MLRHTLAKSGPSLGVGHHKSLNVQTLGGIKDAGPSLGNGHKMVDVETLAKSEHLGIAQVLAIISSPT